MNKFYYVVFALLFLIGCHEVKQETLSGYERYLDAKENAYLSTGSVDTIFLGLRFGMNRQEVNDYLDSLHQKGRLTLDDIGAYAYIMNTDGAKIKCTLGADFFQDKLYYFRLRFKGWNPDLDEEEYFPIELEEFMETLVNKARITFLQSSELKHIQYEKYYYQRLDSANYSSFIRDNLIVEFSPIGLIEYINAPIVKKKEEVDKMNKNKNIKETMSDF